MQEKKRNRIKKSRKRRRKMRTTRTTTTRPIEEKSLPKEWYSEPPMEKKLESSLPYFLKHIQRRKLDKQVLANPRYESTT